MNASIGTITTHSALNYGAALQAYALCRYINDQGVSCEVIDYQPNYTSDYYKLLKSPRSISDAVILMHQIVNYNARKKRREKFESFRENIMTTSDEVLLTKKDLAQYVNQYDLVICGSDQIWSPVLHQFDEAYFMSMPEVKVPHISYAASFGQDHIEEEIKDELYKRLKNFSSFACRENTAVQLIKELVNVDAPLVLDPVFLLDADSWKKLMNPIPVKNKFTLTYFLSNPGQSPYAVKAYSKKNGYTPVSIGFSPRDIKYGLDTIYDLGPCEFLQTIDSSEVIMTNSFHMTAFAIIFRKNFYTRISKGSDSRNDRMLTLLNALGLEDRVYTDENASKLDFDRPINYEKISLKLEALKSQSKNYLNDAIGSIMKS